MPEQAEKNDKQDQNKPMWLKTLLILFGALTLQMLAVSGLWYFSAGPATVQGGGISIAEQALLEQSVEIPLVKDVFQNTRSGRTYDYVTEIYIVTARMHHKHVQQRLDQRQAQIKTEIASIFRRAEPAHLREYELATLKRQIHAMLNEHLGYDEENEPYVHRVLIPKCMQRRADF